MNSKRKGKRGELEFVRLCKARGYEARRTAQYCGNTGEAADVVGLPGVHVEIKHVERLNIQEAIDQAVHDAPPGMMPAVFHRRNNCGWLVTMPVDEWFKIYREAGY